MIARKILTKITIMKNRAQGNQIAFLGSIKYGNRDYLLPKPMCFSLNSFVLAVFQ